jgi:hypothetical protein
MCSNVFILPPKMDISSKIVYHAGNINARKY